MTKSNRIVAAAQFKAECLHLLDVVHNQHLSYIITKRGKPFAKLVPIPDQPVDYFGCMQETAFASGDIVSPIDIEWDAEK